MPNDNDPSIPLTVLNAAVRQPVVYVGVPAALVVALTNKTGGGITLRSAGTASTMTLYVPQFFDPAAVVRMGVSVADWSATADGPGQSFLLTYAGADGATWAVGQTLTFQITNVSSRGSPTADAFQVNFANMGGNVPLQQEAPFSLATPPDPGNAKLSQTLHVSLDSQGVVYVSEPADPLQNALFLNLKNVGSENIYTGTTPWASPPKVTVTFVYGSTSGALAPDDDKTAPAVGSAWNIRSTPAVDQTPGWQVTNPSNTGQDAHPKWVLQPVNTNRPVIGTGAASNVTFQFSNVFSFTPIGHTQMIVQFTGFRQSDTRAYDDQTLVLDVVKQNPPPTRGLLNFFGSNPIVAVAAPARPVHIPVRWAMFDVARVNLFCSFPGVPAYQKTYPDPTPLAYDADTVVIPGISQSTAVFLTLQAFDGNGGYLNSGQFTAFLQATFFVDPRDDKAYPVIQVGPLYWLAANFDFDASSGCCFYNNDPTNEPTYGRLYTPAAARANAPEGWRLPARADWQALIAAVATPYANLIAGGSSGFDAQLGGYRDDRNAFSNDLGRYGYYWAAGDDRSDTYYAQFSGVSQTVGAATTFPDTFAASVRYVRDV